MQLPPLNALKTFEAAARLGGFAAAAQELHVTPAAVSHQVKSLEAHLGTALFQRQPRGLTLTNAGQELLPEVSRGLAHFARAVGGLSGKALAGKLVVNAAPSLAALWLVPRLQSFLQAFPDIELCVLGGLEAPDLSLGKIDVRIVYGSGYFPGLKAQLLMGDSVFPVCAPSLLNQLPLRRFADIRDHILIHDIDVNADEPNMVWSRWLRDAGLGEIQPRGHLEFGNSVLLTEAAVRGQGVALGRLSLTRDHLESGRLLRPFKLARPADYAYYGVTTEAGAQHPRVRVFLDWLAREAEASDAAPRGGDMPLP